MKLKIFLITTLIPILIFFMGCSSSKSDGGDGGDTVKPNPSFANDIQPIFSSSCALSSCHNSGSAQAGLNLTQGQAYANLVNVNSTQVPGLMRVLPSDADNSYIVIKLEGRQTVGGRMPLSGSITNTQLQNIKNWINNGAQNN